MNTTAIDMRLRVAYYHNYDQPFGQVIDEYIELTKKKACALWEDFVEVDDKKVWTMVSIVFDTAELKVILKVGERRVYTAHAYDYLDYDDKFDDEAISDYAKKCVREYLSEADDNE